MGVVAAVLSVIVLGAVSFWAWQRLPELRGVYWPALVLKLGSGLLLGLLYTYYYDVGDTFMFFNDGVALANIARKDPAAYLQYLWSGDSDLLPGVKLAAPQSRSLFLSKAVSVVNLATYDSYWVTSLYFSLFSFAAACYLVRVLSRYFPQQKAAAVFAFLLLPSAVFWSSGIIKETLAIAALYFLAAFFVKIWHKQYPKLWAWLLAPIALWVLISLRYYFAAVFLPVVFTSVCMRWVVLPYLKPQRPLAEVVLWFAVLLLPVLLASVIHPNFYPENFFHVIVLNYETFQQLSHPGDAIVFSGLEPHVLSMLIHAPWAWASGMFRPFPWEVGNVFQALMCAENAALLIAFVAACPMVLKIAPSPHRILLTALIVYTGVLCVFITLTTPNFGTLCRYRIGYLPFFAFLILTPGTITRPLAGYIQKLTRRAE